MSFGHQSGNKSTLVRLPRCRKLVICLSATLLLSRASLVLPENPEQRFQEAVAAEQRGDSETALKLYRTLLRDHPNTLALRVNLAGLLVNLGRFDEAIGQYRAASALSPTNRDVRLGLDFASVQKGDAVSLRRAVSNLELLHKGHPEDAQVAMLLADGYYRQQRFHETVSTLLPIEAAHSDDTDLRLLLGSALVKSGHPDAGIGRIDAVASQTGTADAYLLAGQSRLGMSQYDLSLSAAQAAVAKDPALPGAQTLLGMVLEHMGDYEHAETALRKALALDAEDYDAQFYLGSLLYFNRDIPGAEEHLKHALRLRPASVEARYKQALIAQTKGDLEAAARDLEMVIRQNPEWLEPHVKLSALYYNLHRPTDGAKERAVVDRMIAVHQGEPTPGR